MSNYRFPASLKPIVSKGYSYQRGGNVYRSEVTEAYHVRGATPTLTQCRSL